MARKLMTGKNFMPASLKQRISFLAQQIKTKKTLIQYLIDQKHVLRPILYHINGKNASEYCAKTLRSS